MRERISGISPLATDVILQGVFSIRSVCPTMSCCIAMPFRWAASMCGTPGAVISKSSGFLTDGWLYCACARMSVTSFPGKSCPPIGPVFSSCSSLEISASHPGACRAHIRHPSSGY
ncbi:hypothetical protein FKM82_024273 [Ascaphus truei]